MSVFTTGLLKKIEQRLRETTPARGTTLSDWQKEILCGCGHFVGFAVGFALMVSLGFLMKMVFPSPSTLTVIFCSVLICAVTLSYLYLLLPACVFRFFGEFVLPPSVCRDALSLTKEHVDVKNFVNRIIAKGREVRVADYLTMMAIQVEIEGMENRNWCKRLHGVETD